MTLMGMVTIPSWNWVKDLFHILLALNIWQHQGILAGEVSKAYIAQTVVVKRKICMVCCVL